MAGQSVVTIRDVARRAGVSVATASRAFNGKQLVNSATRARILAVIDELGFTPSPMARRLSLGRTLTIGVVVSFLTRPQAVERLRGIEAVLAETEFDLVIYNVETVAKRNHYLRTLPQSQRTDGLLVVSLPPPPESVAMLERGPVPVVFIDAQLPSASQLPRVVGDDVAGAILAARHLLDLGHRKIGFIGDAVASPFGFTSSQDREAGLKRGLAAAGIAVPDEWLGHGAHGRYQARELARSMLGRDARPSAIFAASDTQAVGVIAAARELGLRVPDDLSVIGYDDIEAADYVGLTTVRQRLFESGQRGAETLLAAMERHYGKNPIVELAPELVVRTTTAPVKEVGT
jgi:LacI family transcriptional regulator